MATITLDLEKLLDEAGCDHVTCSMTLERTPRGVVLTGVLLKNADTDAELLRNTVSDFLDGWNLYIELGVTD